MIFNTIKLIPGGGHKGPESSHWGKTPWTWTG